MFLFEYIYFIRLSSTDIALHGGTGARRQVRQTGKIINRENRRFHISIAYFQSIGRVDSAI